MRERTTVLTEIKTAVAKERESQMTVLRLLREVESDKHFLAMGYPSLFEFAVKELGYSEGAAFRRIESMRLLKEIPEVAEPLATGALSLCVAAKARSFFRRDKTLGKEKKREIVTGLVGKSKRECEQLLSPVKVKPVIRFEADEELVNKLELLKARLGKKDYAALLHALADKALKELEYAPQERKANPRSRNIPKHVKRAVWQRDNGQCMYQDPVTGRRCSSRHALQYDHIQPYALGGESTAENLRLLCPAHNRYAAEAIGLGQAFG